MSATNWRELPLHPADQWDHWNISREDYLHMCEVYDVIANQLDEDDMELVLEMMDFATRLSEMNAADDAAGEDL